MYHILEGQWLRKTFPGLIFANSNVPEKWFWICLKEDEMSELPAHSKNIFKQNMVDLYVDRPNEVAFGEKYYVLDLMSFSEFVTFFHLSFNSKFTDNDYQPEELLDEFLGGNHKSYVLYLKVIPLMSSKEKLKCWKVPSILKLYDPNQETKLEEYAHYLLFMYYPFRNEEDLKLGNSAPYTNKLKDPDVTEVIKVNRRRTEPFGKTAGDALEGFSTDVEAKMDSFGPQENDETF